MLSLKEILELPDEELDKLIETLDINNDEDFIGKDMFKVDGIVYESLFYLSNTSDGKSVMEFKFHLKDNPNKPKRSDFSDERQYKIAVRKAEFGLTGTGNPLRVFRNALSMLIRWVNKHKPDYITFTSDGENRQRLYKKFYEKYGHHIPDYEICKTNPLDGKELDDSEFWLKRV